MLVKSELTGKYPGQDLDCDSTHDSRRMPVLIGATLGNMVGLGHLPGADIRSDDEIETYFRETGGCVSHQVGTCKMGNDAMAVVDDRLRVRGLDGIRVADASIMPTLISGNTNAAVIMIGEKAADLIAEAGSL